ncbi:MAG: 4Fe-4S binding protein [Planctomycetota bacterium]|nr:4Fe-4S binding protein [Planctomycetota bacterium]MDE1889256.1 4Fe-4S binding protein [Planctomycetota bacterium]MDE2216880.1 4Fe-4S binding protein [Planctomycetota bacterium]
MIKTAPDEKPRKRKGIVHINHEYCKRCSICVNFCPVKNLEIRGQKLIELERCTACKICQRYCPDIAIEIEEIDDKTVISGESSHHNGG